MTLTQEHLDIPMQPEGQVEDWPCWWTGRHYFVKINGLWTCENCSEAHT